MGMFKTKVTTQARGCIVFSLTLIMCMIANILLADNSGSTKNFVHKPLTDSYTCTTITLDVLDCPSTGDEEKERLAEIVFVFDTTGSMGGEIEDMQNAVISFTNTLSESGIDYNIGLTEYKDFPTGSCGDTDDFAYKIYNDGNLVSDVKTVQGWIESLEASGGADLPESLLAALSHTVEDQNWSSSSNKVVIIITDAAPHADGDECNVEGNRLDDIISLLINQKITTYAVGPDSATDEYGYTSILRMTEETGGEFYEIRGEDDFEDIIDTIAESIRCTFSVERDSPGIVDSFDSPASSPRGLTYDGKYLWNVDYDKDMIYKLDTFGNIIHSFDSPGSEPSGLAYDGTYLWNADMETGMVYKLDTTGQVIESFESPDLSPRGLVYDDTFLWNADPTEDFIYKISAADHSLIDSFYSPWLAPTGLTYDNENAYLWHADQSLDKIFKLDTSGEILYYFDSPGTSPKGLAFDGAYLWNADSRCDMIYKIDLNDITSDDCEYTLSKMRENLSATGGTVRVNITTGISCAWTVKSDSSWISVTSGTDNSGSGTVTFTVDENSSEPERSGSVIIGEQTFVVTQDPAPILINSFDSPGSAPRGLAYDGAYLWNVDFDSDKIYRLDSSGNITTSFDSPASEPSGLAYDGSFLWNADSGTGVIYKLDTSGNIAASFNAPGSSPRGLAHDGTYLWNADPVTDRIYKLDSSGNIVDSFSSPGPAPIGLAYDGAYLWNSDQSDDKIYRIDTSGTIIDSIDSSGSNPKGLTFDGLYLWNADSGDDKIYKLDVDTSIPSEADPVPDIKVNDSDDPITVTTDDAISISIELQSFSYKGDDADWWLAQIDPEGMLYYLSGDTWNSDTQPLYQQALYDFESTDIASLTDLSEGVYIFYFGVDLNMDGLVTYDNLFYDYVTVNVED